MSLARDISRAAPKHQLPSQPLYGCSAYTGSDITERTFVIGRHGTRDGVGHPGIEVIKTEVGWQALWIGWPGVGWTEVDGVTFCKV